MSGPLVEPTDPTNWFELDSNELVAEIERLRHQVEQLTGAVNVYRGNAEQLRAERVTIAKDTLNQAANDVETVIGQWPGNQPDWVKTTDLTFNGALRAVLRMLRRAAALGDAEPPEDSPMTIGGEPTTAPTVPSDLHGTSDERLGLRPMPGRCRCEVIDAYLVAPGAATRAGCSFVCPIHGDRTPASVAETERRDQ